MTGPLKWASYARVREAAEELKGLIRAKYPDAEFRLARDPDQRRSWLLWTVTDEEDSEEVSRLIMDREIDMLSEELIPLHVIPIPRKRSPGETKPARATRAG